MQRALQCYIATLYINYQGNQGCTDTLLDQTFISFLSKIFTILNLVWYLVIFQ